MGGLRTMSGPGEFFHKPDIIQKMRAIFEKELKPEIVFKACEMNFCDSSFADFCAQEMENLIIEEKWEAKE